MKDKLSYINYCIGILVLFFLFTVSINEAKAANYVRVATIGARVPKLDKTMGPQKMVDEVILFWKKELEQVIYDKPDLIVLPENSDFPGGLSQAERNEFVKVRQNQILDYFASVAKANNCYIVFGMRREDNGGYWNSAVLLDRQGETAGIYNKNFPTIGEMENGIKVSDEVPVFECDFGRLAIAICYDLNFDNIREKYVALKPDIIVFPSVYHGGFVQSIWAYTCRAYFVGSISGNGPKNSRSEILNPLGEIISSSTNYFDYTVASINLDVELAHLDYNWGRLRALKKKYGNAVTITDPGSLGAVMIASEDKDVNVKQMIKEFQIELLDEYFDRSHQARKEHLAK